MELRDLIVTPIVILVVLIAAYIIRPMVTDAATRRYFMPALLVRIVGAMAVGFVYQFYYVGGDTFAFHTHGSRIVWEAIMEEPLTGIRLLFSDGTHVSDYFSYSSRIWYFRDQQSFFVIRIATILDLFTFSTYTATAVLFAVFGFSGAWLMFITFYKRYPGFHVWIAVACLFIPTVVFWGSGIFKDTLTLAALGWATFACYGLFFQKRNLFINALITLISFWVIFSMKKYILLSFLPAILLWVFTASFSRIRTLVAKILVVPVVMAIVIVLGYFTIVFLAEDDPRYNVSRLAETAKITAYDIRYGWGARTGEGSGYNLGELDGTWQSMIRLAPAAINVSLFRPYFWEVENPLMVLSAFESLFCMLLTIFVIYRSRHRLFRCLGSPDVLFCLCFALIFAFAVGVSTYNFGTLSRYRIPLMPFYGMAIGLILYYSNRDRKLASFEATE